MKDSPLLQTHSSPHSCHSEAVVEVLFHEHLSYINSKCLSLMVSLTLGKSQRLLSATSSEQSDWGSAMNVFTSLLFCRLSLGSSIHYTEVTIFSITLCKDTQKEEFWTAVKDTLLSILLEILFAFKTFILPFLPLSEAIVEVLFCKCLAALSWLPQCFKLFVSISII